MNPAETDMFGEDGRPYLADRPLPSNVEAESLALGCTILDNGLAPQLVGETQSDDYFKLQNRLCFDAIKRLVERGRAIDPLTLQEELRLMGKLQDAGGPSYVASLFDGVPRFSNIDNYIKIIKDRSVKRRLIKDAGWLMNEAFANDTEGDQLLTFITERLREIEQRALTSDLIGSAEAVERTWRALEENWERGDAMLGLSTGIAGLDRILYGLQRGKFITLAAPTSLGKTALALNIAWNVMLTGQNFLQRPPVCLFITLEMEVEELQQRLWARVADVGLDDLMTGNLNEAERRQIRDAMRRIAQARIEFNDGTQNITPRGLEARMERTRRKYGFLDLVVIDYLHLMEPDKMTENEQTRLSNLSRGIQQLARRYKVPMLVLSQLNRESQGVAPRDPVLSDLRGSGSIEQDSNVVIFIGREDYKNPDDVRRKLIVAKNRGGRAGANVTVPMIFFGNRQLFGQRDPAQDAPTRSNTRQPNNNWGDDFAFEPPSES